MTSPLAALSSSWLAAAPIIDSEDAQLLCGASAATDAVRQQAAAFIVTTRLIIYISVCEIRTAVNAVLSRWRSFHAVM